VTKTVIEAQVVVPGSVEVSNVRKGRATSFLPSLDFENVFEDLGEFGAKLSSFIKGPLEKSETHELHVRVDRTDAVALADALENLARDLRKEAK